MKKIILSLALICGCTALLAQEQPPAGTQKIMENKNLLLQVPDKPMLKVFDAAYNKTPYENVMMSAWGIQECFGMIYGGAGEKSAAEMTQFLGIDKTMAPTLKQARESLKKSKEKFNSFNAVFYNRNLTLLKSFADFTVNIYKGSLQPTDFSKTKEAVQQLNECVKRESEGMLDQIFTEEDIAGSPAMVLLNVLYFKGAWMKSFEVHRTRRENFFTPTAENWGKMQQVQVDMMNSKRLLPYYNDGTVHGIALDYKDPRFKMLVLTTVKKETPLNVLIKTLAEKGAEHFLKNSSIKNQTVMKLPKLKLSCKLDLKNLFTSLGMKVLFSAQQGDLTGIVQGQPLHIGEAKQIVKLDLDEAGSEVAAVTYAVARMTSARPRKEELNHFYADHPFVLVLFDSKTNAVLLTAAVIKP